MTKDTPNPAALPAVRAQLEAAHEKILNACKTFRMNGWPENAEELYRSAQHLGVWTMKDGWLDCLERPDGPDLSDDKDIFS